MKYLLWLFSKIFKPKKRYPVLLAEIQDLQIYCYQTKDEYDRQKPYKECFWSLKNKAEKYGPFTSINQACAHYEWFKLQPPIQNNIIYYDFHKRQRR